MAEEAPLWHAESQQERMKELLGDPADIKELPLRRDVRSLGQLLGNILREQEGDRLYEVVEALRRLSITARSSTHAFEPAHELIKDATVIEAGKLAKAFATYFELTNL